MLRLGVIGAAQRVDERQPVLVILGGAARVELGGVIDVARYVGAVALEDLGEHVVGLLPGRRVEEGLARLRVDQWAEELVDGAHPPVEDARGWGRARDSIGEVLEVVVVARVDRLLREPHGGEHVAHPLQRRRMRYQPRLALRHKVGLLENALHRHLGPVLVMEDVASHRGDGVLDGCRRRRELWRIGEGINGGRGGAVDLPDAARTSGTSPG
mmetsp:Transcript_14668/g.31806  ORF Transcript_14668/g.31806 Transcript_14668/m.31806 type:complete len:213 (+) Transcript_14668:208-846(+)